MAKFKIRVIVKAECEYEVEVEADTESQAEDLAISKDYEMLPDDFQVNKGYVTDWEIDECQQLTHVCLECGTEYPAEIETAAPIATYTPHPLQPWREDSDYCEVCGPKVEAEEAEKYARLVAAARSASRAAAARAGSR